MSNDNAASGILPKTAKEIEEFVSAIGGLWYRDPDTGYIVLTSRFLRERGYCCSNNCRHCPYSQIKDRGKDVGLEEDHGT